jgi:hypothetical protein
VDHFRHWYHLHIDSGWRFGPFVFNEMAQIRQVAEKVVPMYMSFVRYEFRKYTQEYESDDLDA